MDSESISTNLIVSIPKLLSTCTELENIGVITPVDIDYGLWNDIDCSTRSPFTPIATTVPKFSGSINGYKHTISHLTISSGSGPPMGLIAKCTDCRVSNLKIEGASILGTNSASILIAEGEGIIYIQNVHTEGNISANCNSGGIVGYCKGVCNIECSSSQLVTTVGVANYHGILVKKVDNLSFYFLYIYIYIVIIYILITHPRKAQYRQMVLGEVS